MIHMGRRVIPIGEGPCVQCPECGDQVPFDLKLVYYSLCLGALGWAGGLRWLFQCRACREEWRAKRSLVRELEQGGLPIPFLERDGLLLALAALVLVGLLLRL
jgi:hypothetical protein